MAFTSYTTKQGDRWDTIAFKAYGNSLLFHRIIMANPDVVIQSDLPSGLSLYIPILTDPATGEDLPPWKTGEDEIPDEITSPGYVIPIDQAPIVALAFAPSFPKVEGNKIAFAINKTGSYPWTVKKVSDGSIVASSTLYSFTAGFPVYTPDITDGGLYVVQVGSLISSELTVVGTGSGIAFTTSPYFDSAAEVLFIKYAINKSGNFIVKLTNLDTSVVVSNTSVAHNVDELKTITVAVAGNYKLEVHTLNAVLEVALNESTTRRDWLTHLQVTYAAGVQACTMWLTATEDCELSIERQSGVFIQGLTDIGTWVAKIYTEGTSTFVSPPETEHFRLNANTAEPNGVAPSTPHYIKIRRISARQDVMRIPWTSPATDQLTKTDIVALIVPDPGPGPDPELDYVPMFLNRSPIKQINIQITGEPGNWLISEGATPQYPVNSGHGLRYLINGEVHVPPSGVLTNYPWPSNEPLTIIKTHYKLVCTPYVPFADACAPDYYIAPFNANNYGAHCNIYFKPNPA